MENRLLAVYNYMDYYELISTFAPMASSIVFPAK